MKSCCLGRKINFVSSSLLLLNDLAPMKANSFKTRSKRLRLLFHSLTIASRLLCGVFFDWKRKLKLNREKNKLNSSQPRETSLTGDRKAKSRSHLRWVFRFCYCCFVICLLLHVYVVASDNALKWFFLQYSHFFLLCSCS